MLRRFLRTSIHKGCSLPQLLILSYSEAGMLLAGHNRPDIQAVIAIYGQREHPVDVTDIPHTLVLHFDDADVPDSDDPIAVAQLQYRRRLAAEFGLDLSPPTIEHARRIIDFARSITDLPGLLLCQCHAGISRSPAAALLCLATWTAPGQEAQCVNHILAIRPPAQPHRDLVRFGDAILSRAGQLTSALDAALPQ